MSDSDLLVQVEMDAPVRVFRASRRFPDIVQQDAQTHVERRASAGRFPKRGERVLPHIVQMVLVLRQRRRGPKAPARTDPSGPSPASAPDRASRPARAVS